MKVLLLTLFVGLSTTYPTEYTDSVNAALGRIKTFLGTDEGVRVSREYITALDATSPTGFMVKSFMDTATDDILKGLLNEILKNVPNGDIEDADIDADFIVFEEFLRTDLGPLGVQNYFNELNTDNQIVFRLKTLITGASIERLREIIDTFLPDVPYLAFKDYEYDVKSDLRSLFSQIRAILVTKEGLQVVKDFAEALDPSHPALFLVKMFIISAEDKALLEILDEVFKGLSYSADYVSAEAQLEDLFLQVREIIKTEEGFQALRSYLVGIQSEHPIVQRLRDFISTATAETLRELLDALYGEFES